MILPQSPSLYSFGPWLLGKIGGKPMIDISLYEGNNKQKDSTIIDYHGKIINYYIIDIK